MIIWFKSDEIGSNWIKSDQVGSNWIKLVPVVAKWFKLFKVVQSVLNEINFDQTGSDKHKNKTVQIRWKNQIRLNEINFDEIGP